MKLLMYAWKDDKAGMNIYNNLMKHFEFKEIDKEFDGNKVFKCEKDGNEFFLTLTEELFYKKAEEYNDLVNNTFPEVDVVIAIIWHAGKSGPLLSVHPVGEVNKENFVTAPAKLMKSLLKNYAEQKELLGLEEFEVCMEATHSSYPIKFDKPLIDFEIGSLEKEHTNELAGKAAAFALMSLSLEDWPVGIALGGLHYATKFTKVQLESKIAIGHIVTNLELDKLSKEFLEKIIEKTKEEVKYLVMVKKEKGEHKQLARKLAEDLGLEFVTDGLACQTK